MKQSELNHAVADATNETVSTIKSMGFSLADESTESDVADQQILVLDCPFCGTTVLLSANGPEELPELAECPNCDVVYDYADDEVYVVEIKQIADAPFVSAA